MDRLELMHIVVTAVDAGSFSAAARKLGLPLTTVSRKIAALERHLHTQLFTRATRRIGLTDAGMDYVLGCRRVLQEVREMERAVGGEYAAPKGDLWITAPLVFGRLHVLPIVTGFLRAYPEVDVRLSLSDRVVNLLEEPVDLALRIGHLPDSSLVATRLGTIRVVTCASPEYLKRHGTPKNPGAVSAHECVTFEGLMSSREWHFEGAGSRAPRTVTVRSRVVVSTAEAAIDAAIAGVGLTRVLSYQIAGAVAAGSLKIILEDYESAPRPVSFTYRSGPLLPLKLRAFLDYSTPRLREALGGA
jgi:DNA-binding transcriptional LysR family regulator